MWPVIAMSYNPHSVSGRMLFDVVCDATPSGQSAASAASASGKGVAKQIDSMAVEGGATGLGSAALLEGTVVSRTQRLRDTLFCLGGVAVFLPLLGKLCSSEKGGEGRWSAGQVVGLLASVLEGSLTSILQFSQMGGPGLLGHLLKTVSPANLSSELLLSLERLYRILLSEGTGGKDAGVAAQLILSLELWARASPGVQKQYHATLMRMAKVNTESASLAFRRPQRKREQTGIAAGGCGDSAEKGSGQRDSRGRPRGRSDGGGGRWAGEMHSRRGLQFVAREARRQPLLPECRRPRRMRGSSSGRPSALQGSSTR